jgi:hypothetical protein
MHFLQTMEGLSFLSSQEVDQRLKKLLDGFKKSWNYFEKNQPFPRMEESDGFQRALVSSRKSCNLLETNTDCAFSEMHLLFDELDRLRDSGN